MLGAALGASIGIPAGLLQDYLVTLLPPDHQKQRQLRMQQTESIIAGEGEKQKMEIRDFFLTVKKFHVFIIFLQRAVQLERPEVAADYDPAGAVIRQLEASLAGSPTQINRNTEVAVGEESGSEQQRSWWKVWSR